MSEPPRGMSPTAEKLARQARAAIRTDHRITVYNVVLVICGLSFLVLAVYILAALNTSRDAAVERDAAITAIQEELKTVCRQADFSELPADGKQRCRRAEQNRLPPEVEVIIEEGTPGPTGAEGEQGPRGEKGEKGDRGRRGLTGARGVRGLMGLQGPAGEKGDPCDPDVDPDCRGPKGDPGGPGPKGDPCDPAVNPECRGPKGDPGTDAPVIVNIRFDRNADGDCIVIFEFDARDAIHTGVPEHFCTGKPPQ